MTNSHVPPGSLENDNIRLIKAFQANDSRAFDRLILLHKKMVFNLCYKLLNNYTEADDCAQEVFIKIYRSLNKFRFEASFTTWLYRITVNTCKNKLNSLEFRLRFRKMKISHRKSQQNDPPSVEVQDDSLSPVSVLQRKEIYRHIQDAVNRLHAQQRIIVILRDMEGCSYAEIVAITGFKLGTVKSKLSRARQQLRYMLKGSV